MKKSGENSKAYLGVLPRVINLLNVTKKVMDDLKVQEKELATTQGRLLMQEE
jgi:hypothetical protein